MQVFYQYESNVELPHPTHLQGQNYLLLAMGHIIDSIFWEHRKLNA